MTDRWVEGARSQLSARSFASVIGARLPLDRQWASNILEKPLSGSLPDGTRFTTATSISGSVHPIETVADALGDELGGIRRADLPSPPLPTTPPAEPDDAAKPAVSHPTLLVRSPRAPGRPVRRTA